MLESPSNRVSNDLSRSREIIRQLRRPHKGDLRAMAPGYFGHRRIIRRHQDPIENSRTARGLDRPGNHRLAAKGADVLARNALAAAARRHDGNGSSWLCQGYAGCWPTVGILVPVSGNARTGYRLTRLCRAKTKIDIRIEAGPTGLAPKLYGNRRAPECCKNFIEGARRRRPAGAHYLGAQRLDTSNAEIAVRNAVTTRCWSSSPSSGYNGRVSAAE
jgi:hypothetical protein